MRDLTVTNLSYQLSFILEEFLFLSFEVLFEFFDGFGLEPWLGFEQSGHVQLLQTGYDLVLDQVVPDASDGVVDDLLESSGAVDNLLSNLLGGNSGGGLFGLF